jgi:hypothetical protein
MWKVYSLFQGDSSRIWNESAFQIYMGGQIIVPPKHEDFVEIETVPSNICEEMRIILNKLENTKASICNGMIFCLENSDYAGEIVSLIDDTISK